MEATKCQNIELSDPSSVKLHYVQVAFFYFYFYFINTVGEIQFAKEFK